MKTNNKTTDQNQKKNDEIYKQALEHFNAERYSETDKLCFDILQNDPNHIGALNLIASIARIIQRHDIAVKLFQRAIDIDNSKAFLFYNLGDSLNKLGRSGEAVKNLKIAVELEPENGQYNDYLKETIASLIPEKNIENPQQKAHELLQQGVSFHQSGNFNKAIHLYKNSLAIQPENTAALSCMGAALQSIGKLDLAIESYNKAVAINPNYAEAYYNLGAAKKVQGNLSEAVDSYKKAIAINPEYAGAYSNIGIIYYELGLLEEAVNNYQKAIAIIPDYALAYSNLGNAQIKLGKIDLAVENCQKAIAIKPDYAEAYCNLGNALHVEGKVKEAIESYEKAIEINPNFIEAGSNLLLTSQYLPDQTFQNLFKIHKNWADFLFKSSDIQIYNHKNDTSLNRRLKIGIVSGDLRQHPVGYFMLGLLKHHSATNIDIICYSDNKPDNLTSDLKGDAYDWVFIQSMGNIEVANHILNDKIDILIDLSGHTAHNRLSVFAKKPAPIQISWAGYVSTTALSTMDYLIADSHHILEDEEKYYTEKIIRLPNSWICYTPPKYAPDAKLKHSNRVVLGNFGNTAKINENMLETWANILLKCPQTDLLLIFRGMDSSSNVKRVKNYFNNVGIDINRITMGGSIPHEELLKKYNSIYIALDTLPYSGGLTTLEALWMGVPVVTTKGETFAGRHSTSINSTVGMGEFITNNLDEYAQLVIDLVEDPERVYNIKKHLRDKIASSPLCDHKTFSANFAQELRKVWIKWCEENTYP
ncbi:MAG: tetratricopeptide repeat protein [Magnetococcales bacterium]|nr:tetratricopeptide repeat protein [Magnetococcales bacterium]